MRRTGPAVHRWSLSSNRCASGYFIKNLDQTNISNAYVSGMKEDLQMNSNELNMIDVAWTCGYVIGQVPSQIVTIF